MNADFQSGALKLGLKSNLGYADIGWQKPRIDLDSIDLKFENNLIRSQMTLVLPYRWKNLLGSREKTREFKIDIVQKQEVVVKEGTPIFTTKSKNASNIRGGDKAHRDQVNFLTKVADFFGDKTNQTLQEKMKKWMDENSQQMSLGSASGHIEQDNLVYD